jgi:hypothetical protein
VLSSVQPTLHPTLSPVTEYKCISPSKGRRDATLPSTILPKAHETIRVLDNMVIQPTTTLVAVRWCLSTMRWNAKHNRQVVGIPDRVRYRCYSRPPRPRFVLGLHKPGSCPSVCAATRIWSLTLMPDQGFLNSRECHAGLAIRLLHLVHGQWGVEDGPQPHETSSSPVLGA